MKKKNSLKLAAVTFCLLSVIGCKNPPKGETIFKPIVVAEQVHLTADTHLSRMQHKYQFELCRK